MNLPLHYKLDLSIKDETMRSKRILKKLFCKYLNKKLIFKKMGFSGHPNSMRNNKDIYHLTKEITGITDEKLSLSKKFYYDKKNFYRDMEWKFINSERFLNVYK